METAKDFFPKKSSWAPPVLIDLPLPLVKQNMINLKTNLDFIGT